jgi:hypothetical protein
MGISPKEVWNRKVDEKLMIWTWDASVEFEMAFVMLFV